MNQEIRFVKSSYKLSQNDTKIITNFKRVVKNNVYEKDKDYVFLKMNKVSNHQTKYIGSTSLSYEDIEKVTRCEFLNDKLGDFYINLLQEREYRFHHQKLKRADQTCFMFLDCLKTTQIKHPILKHKDRDILRNVRFTQRRMIEEKKTDKIPKNYETFLLNNICSMHYTCLHIKFGALLNDINK